MTTTEKPVQGWKRRAAVSPGSKPQPGSQITRECPSHSFQSPPTYLHPLSIGCLRQNWVQKLICEPGSQCSVLWPQNKARAVASALLLAAQIRSENEPPWPGWGSRARLGPDQFGNTATCLYIQMLPSSRLTPILRLGGSPPASRGSIIYFL